MKKIGISSTLPIEVLYAAEYRVYDLNNLFINSHLPQGLIEFAHETGLSRTTCGWTKGVFAAALKFGFDKVVNVVSGDCSNNHVMGEILKKRGVEVIPFFYPYPRNRDDLKKEVESLMRRFGVTWSDVEGVFNRFSRIRSKLLMLEKITIEEGKINGNELLAYLISGSDMRGNPESFEKEIDSFLCTVEKRPSLRRKIRAGVIGIPPMFTDLFSFLEEHDVQVVYIETAKEFGRVGEFSDIIDVYHTYSYPYELSYRLERIKDEIKKRGIDILIHYVQSFCFHRNEHLFFSENISIPVLRVEGDLPGPMDEATRVRVESFLKSAGLKSGGERNNYTYHGDGKIDIPLLAVDAGSRNVKMALKKGKDLSLKVVDTIAFIKKHIMPAENGRVDLSRVIVNYFDENVKNFIALATGYGRHQLKWENVKVIPEIEAHFWGVRSEIDEDDFTILDMGGQDTKVIRVRKGIIDDFIMNDKCAAGGGRYLENMARILEIPLEEMGNYFENPEKLDITCATFGETELVGKMIKGVPIERLAAGVNWSVFRRSLYLVKKLYSPVLVLSGGVALNRAIVKYFEESGEFEKVIVVREPQFTGVKGLIFYGEKELEKIV